MTYQTNEYDVVVVGAGHAGCEAALACARLGLKTIIFAINIDSVAMMACNPSIGGTSKGHLVKEIDALGGEMGKVIDRTFLQSRMLNTAKGPAVHSLRVQADKNRYSQEMKKILENQVNLTLRQNEITEILTKNDKVIGVKTISNTIYPCQSVILSAGTYLKSRCIYGDVSIHTGPSGLQSSNHLSDNLKSLGIDIVRFKTGTPARVDKRTIDFTKIIEQKGDEQIIPFSFDNKKEDVMREQISCWLTYTNENTHTIIQNNLNRSPLYSGVIEGTGPRYCPSIEDKVVRFADKNRHQVFLEPEGEDTNEMYVGGMSSSLPEDVQVKMYRSVDGLEKVEIMRNAYAIEYDCINPLNLQPTLELKHIEGFFSCGQINGSSGYEEAAAQGLIAGINASMKLLKKDLIVLDRSEAYIGVLIDDLVTKGTNEPYRMMTSRAEYRLLLRQDNADLRLRRKGYEIGLITKEQYNKLIEKENNITKEIERLKNTIIGATKEVQAFLEKEQSTLLKSGSTLYELVKRPELSYESLKAIDKDRKILEEDVVEQVNIQIKYEGYIKRQLKQVEQFKKLENKRIPEDIDYSIIKSLRQEAIQKLMNVKPLSIGQASRISGVSPADISVLLVYLEQVRRQKKG
ncbi:tRNA uridine 5-carboxymethylaminomethyl modification enzyme [Natranaerovirga hydrolytica]|uniref:tRNA uridine 5-carboxymethylaminomethyl modification enzyme MnmG n=1 Tax=Natranaerovirga hydrolytica TaxID=680378 RepID=A0A4R1M3V2_9FIRM|nr:tRNA uridine-5-carboxymethylaminomethyl(34) synthesis enzyme MnmG [Natranaerovirga hydrolytica]TCK86786.1 tRNA uridine 5-carboxymethylaminomethyl modification enzyme [Natranaerovirga hydrolytica]